jgi:hypothetical protein
VWTELDAILPRPDEKPIDPLSASLVGDLRGDWAREDAVGWAD